MRDDGVCTPTVARVGTSTPPTETGHPTLRHDHATCLSVLTCLAGPLSTLGAPPRQVVVVPVQKSQTQTPKVDDLTVHSRRQDRRSRLEKEGRTEVTTGRTRDRKGVLSTVAEIVRALVSVTVSEARGRLAVAAGRISVVSEVGPGRLSTPTPRPDPTSPLPLRPDPLTRGPLGHTLPTLCSIWVPR